MTDESITELFNARSENAISELNAKYGSRCRALSYNILNNLQDCEECVNDSYLVLWNKIPPEKPQCLVAYLLSVVRKLSLKRCEYNHAEKRNSSLDVALDELCEALPDKASVEGSSETAQLGKFINEFLAELSKENRVMFVWRYWYGCSVKDIAKQSGYTAHAVTVRLSRTRANLKNYLEKRGYYCE